MWISADSSPFVGHCCFWQNGAPAFYPDTWNPIGSEGNFSGDPLFLAPWNGDYRLRPGSPCIGAGDNSVVQAGWLDMDGKPRILPEGGIVDIGCFEWDETPYWVRLIGQARAISEGFQIELRDKAITATLDGAFYIEEANRTAGLRILSGQGVTLGGLATVTGQMVLDNGERALLAASVSATSGVPENIPGPLLLPNRSLGGGDYFWHTNGENCGQQRVTGASGLNNIGLLVRACGRVVERDATWFTIDDGSGVNVKCLMPSGVTLDAGYTFVGVTGISSCEKDVSEFHRLLLVRVQEDITPF